MKSIRVEKIDALIASLKSITRSDALIVNMRQMDYIDFRIQLLEKIKKESEEMIPLSQLEEIIDNARYAEDIEEDVCELVSELNNQRGHKKCNR